MMAGVITGRGNSRLERQRLALKVTDCSVSEFYSLGRFCAGALGEVRRPLGVF